MINILNIEIKHDIHNCKPRKGSGLAIINLCGKSVDMSRPLRIVYAGELHHVSQCVEIFEPCR